MILYSHMTRDFLHVMNQIKLICSWKSGSFVCTKKCFFSDLFLNPEEVLFSFIFCFVMISFIYSTVAHLLVQKGTVTVGDLSFGYLFMANAFWFCKRYRWLISITK